MFDEITYEELNQMIENQRSEPFDTYFGDMELSESEKKKRISLAEKLEENFLPILIFLFILNQHARTVDWEEIRTRFENGYRDSVKEFTDIDSQLNIHIKSFSQDVTESTKRHINDFYYYSTDRAKLISENESNTTLSYQEFMDAVNSGKTMKQWVDIRDRKERETHREVGGTVKRITEPFLVGDSIMNYPRDFTFSASPSEIVNCRCSIKYF